MITKMESFSIKHPEFIDLYQLSNEGKEIRAFFVLPNFNVYKA